jgi:hypothetical protein
MNHFDVALGARAFRDGRAARRAAFRHRHLVQEPIGIVLFQLGAEPFSAAAIGFGCSDADLTRIVAGEPRNREGKLR